MTYATCQDQAFGTNFPIRIRFKIIGNLPNGRSFRNTAQPLEQREGVIWVQVNEKCASLAIGYDPELLPAGRFAQCGTNKSFSPQETGIGAVLFPSTAAPVPAPAQGRTRTRSKKPPAASLSISAVLGIQRISFVRARPARGPDSAESAWSDRPGLQFSSYPLRASKNCVRNASTWTDFSVRAPLRPSRPARP